MAASANNVEQMNGWYKERYAKKYKDLIPDETPLFSQIQFKASAKLGNQYHEPVNLGLEHGFSYGGTGGDAFALQASIAGQTRDAVVQGHEMVLRSTISVGAASRAAAGGEASFGKLTDFVVGNMMRSFGRRMEAQIMYGKRGLGTSAGTSAAEKILITDATWAPGIWAGAENMLIDVYQSDNATLRVANLEIASVNFDDRSITVKTGATAVVVSGDIIYYKGSFGNEFDGIDSIIRNTGSLYGINATSFALWKGNLLDNGGSVRDLSFRLITDAVTRLIEKGLGKQTVKVLINPLQFDVLLEEQDAKRLYDSSYSSVKHEAGSTKLVFHSQNGLIEVESSMFVKAGSAYVLSMDEFSRVGSSEITNEIPGYGDQFFRLLENSNGYELRLYTDQSLFCSSPARQALLTDLSVTPSAS